MERLPTHVAGLDDVLGGGIPLHSTILIAGAPGSGKTILANQIAYSNATSEYRALIVTTVSEPLSRAVRFVQEFTFFDLDKLGSAVLYEDVGPLALKRNGENLVAHIASLVEQYEPTILVIDSFKAICDLVESPGAFRRETYELAARLAALPCTTFLVGEYRWEDVMNSPEASIADGILELTLKPIGLRDFRSLRVRKLRGSDFRSGEHAFRIVQEGIRVFPRFVTPARPERYEASVERVSTGIPGLDELVGGGLYRGTATLVAGDPGVGKTVTALFFLVKGALAGEPGVYVSFQEDPSQLRRIAKNFGFDLDQLEAAGSVRMLYKSPVELDIDEHVPLIVEAVESVGARRVVIDSVRDFEAGAARDADRYFNYVYSLVQWFKTQGITSMLTGEMSRMFGTDVVLSGRGVSHIADNLIALRYSPDDSTIRRAIAVLCTRGSEHSAAVREYRISEPDGPSVGELLPGVFTAA